MPETAAPRCHALVPCAGVGARAGVGRPKQYQRLAGQPLVMHTLAALAAVPQIHSGWVVVSPEDRYRWPTAQWPAHFVRVPCGGATRAHSVYAGLKAMLAAGVPDKDWVLVHDAARCLVTAQAIAHLIETSHQDPVGGILALPVPDTLKNERHGRARSTAPREAVWLAQTPQMFRLRHLHDALEQAARQDFLGITDESSAFERLGLHALLVPGSADNFKITYPEDFAMAEAVLRARRRRRTQEKAP